LFFLLQQLVLADQTDHLANLSFNLIPSWIRNI
jgi:hypothetical protein